MTVLYHTPIVWTTGILLWSKNHMGIIDVDERINFRLYYSFGDYHLILVRDRRSLFYGRFLIKDISKMVTLEDVIL